MLLLILGGSASGKSRLAEEYCKNLGEKRLYIATMRPVDDESRARVLRHQKQRAGYGFSTSECYATLSELSFDTEYDAALLECMGTLVANEMFEFPTTQALIVDKIMDGIDHILKQVDNLVIVSNMVFADSCLYDADTISYIRTLGQLNARIAEKSDAVAEVVCGLPLILKGRSMIP